MISARWFNEFTSITKRSLLISFNILFELFSMHKIFLFHKKIFQFNQSFLVFFQTKHIFTIKLQRFSCICFTLNKSRRHMQKRIGCDRINNQQKCFNHNQNNTEYEVAILDKEKHTKKSMKQIQSRPNTKGNRICANFILVSINFDRLQQLTHINHLYNKMKYFKKLTGTQIFQKITQIAGIKLKSENQKTVQNNNEEEQLTYKQGKLQKLQKQQSQQKPIKDQKVYKTLKIQNNKNQQINQDYELTYEDSQAFVINLVENVKKINSQEKQKKRKKNIYQDLQVQPIYLQKCDQSTLLKMECQIGLFEGAQRAQVLHSYLNQVKQAIKKLLSLSEVSLLQFFQIYNKYLTKLQMIFEHIKTIRNKINKIKTNKYKQIQLIARKRLILKQKINILKKMKQKNQFSIVYPKNLDQIYYSQRNRHKMYIKIKNLKSGTQTSYFLNLKKQIIEISKSNVKIIQQNFNNWVNDRNMTQKEIQKLLICIYFIKQEALYKDNQLNIRIQKQFVKKLKQKLEAVKKWKEYKYIRDRGMKDKIIQFLDDLPMKIVILK